MNVSRFKIVHKTGHKYDGTVTASYNEVRLTPMTLPWQTTLSSQIDVLPAGSSMHRYQYFDYWATQVTAFDLHKPHRELNVTATSVVELSVPPPPRETLDWQALRHHSDTHSELLSESSLTRVSAALVAQSAAAIVGKAPRHAAESIACWVRDNVAYMPGSTGVQTNAQEAWDLRKGVCQDIAHLTVGLLRAHGIPTRYVSGYLDPRRDPPLHEKATGQSHAWVEWWCGDWVGFDPTNGVPIGTRHVVVGRGRDYNDVTPLKGIIFGATGSANLGAVTVDLTRLA